MDANEVLVCVGVWGWDVERGLDKAGFLDVGLKESTHCFGEGCSGHFSKVLSNLGVFDSI